MNQDQQPQPWWKDNWPILFLAALAVVITTIISLGYALEWTWTGHDTKLAWDWLELLIIPLVLSLGAFWFNNQIRKSDQEIAHRDRENDRQIAADRVQEEALHRYLDKMHELILDKRLRKPEEDAEIRNVARARTLAVLRSLDGNRKGHVVRFLCEAGLLGKVRNSEVIIDLRTADLSGANLKGADLSDAYLLGARGWTNEQLAQAESLVGVTLPDGTVIKTKEDEEVFKKRYRQ